VLWHASVSGVLYAVCLAGALALSVYPLVNRRQQAPPWSKFAIMLLGLSITCWSVLGFAGLWLGSSASRSSIYLINYFKTLAGGIGVGIFLTLCIAGEMKITRTLHGAGVDQRPPNKSLQRTGCAGR